jgi:hypothetical protein
MFGFGGHITGRLGLLLSSTWLLVILHPDRRSFGDAGKLDPQSVLAGFMLTFHQSGLSQITESRALGIYKASPDGRSDEPCDGDNEWSTIVHREQD